MVNRFVFKLRV